MRAKILLALSALTISWGAINAQSSAPVVVPATDTVTTTSPTSVAANGAAEQDASSKAATMQMLQQLKAANAEILKRQTATLQQLDEIEKAAQELKIFSSRG
jgi:mRNA-degrading endonuclease toxin of MazEF toxin-antitoxin module